LGGPRAGESGFERRVDAVLARWVGFVERYAAAVAWAIVALTLVALGIAAARLGINSDNIRLLGEELPVRQRHDEFARVFPNLTNALLVVVDGPTPEAARQGAERLAARLAGRSGDFTDVYLPGAGPFFERNGLLYLTPEELSELGDQIARLQPFLIALEREPTIARLASLVHAGLERFPSAGDPAAMAAVLDRIGHATVSVYEEYPVAVSWEDLFVRGSALEATTRQVIVAEPILDFDSALPAADALRAVRAEAAALAAPELRVRVTGNPALNHEEMLALVWDVGVSGVVSFALVVGLLWLALRSWRLTAAGVATLLVGLVWTTAFAALAIGDLNLISLTFAVMYIGLGIDFAIHFGMHYAELRRQGTQNETALRGATRLVGSSLVLCALTTTIGFYAFLPTDYLGVAELGAIAGTGMVVILFQALTLFPALLFSWLRPPAGDVPKPELRLPAGWSGALARHPRAVRRAAALAALACLFALPFLRFDPNVVELRNPRTESVQAFQDLVAAGGAATPWYADVLAPDLATANALAARLRETPGVARAITLSDYVPADQEDKRAILADVALLLEPGVGETPAPAATPAEQIAALRALRDTLAAERIERDATAFGASARKLRGELDAFLARVERDADPRPELARLEAALLGSLPRQLARLRTALDPQTVSAADLPRQLASRMLAADGRARVQVFAVEDLRDAGALARFADAVQSVAPDATGMAIDVVGFARVISRSLVEALAAATLAIALLVYLLWRRLEDVLLVLAPLALAGLGIASATVVLGLSFNFANAIVLPLLLGVGVDSGIHLVHRARAGGAAGDGLLATTTARAVFYSFATTVISFGNLAFSAHRGIASLGLLLTIGLSLTTFCNLVVLPALIEWRIGRRGDAVGFDGDREPAARGLAGTSRS
jgi:hopanoid biosynthesis associated RND transporter like protein HpnN